MSLIKPVLADVCDKIFQGIITGADKIFVLEKKCEIGKKVVELVRITQAFCRRAAKPRNTMDNPMKVLMSEYKKHLNWPGNMSATDSCDVGQSGGRGT